MCDIQSNQNDRNNRYFQDWLDDRTIIRGYINQETLKGFVGIYECNNSMWIDLNIMDLSVDGIENKTIKDIYKVLRQQSLV